MKRKWRVELYNIARNEFSPSSSKPANEGQARETAKKITLNQFDDIDCDGANDYCEEFQQGRIRVYIVRPDGTKYRFVPDR